MRSLPNIPATCLKLHKDSAPFVVKATHDLIPTSLGRDRRGHPRLSMTGDAQCRVAFGYLSAALQLLFLFMLLVWHNREAEALDRVALAHSEA